MTDSQPNGFLALPQDGKGPGVLVLHAWWGLNDTLKNFCTRLAKEGFVAFAPDLYHGQVADTIADAEILSRALDANYLQAKEQVAEAAKFLRQTTAWQEGTGQSERGLAVIGFSLGASYALAISNDAPESIRAVVVFYGTWVDDLSNARASYLGHFAENDEFEPQSSVDKLEEYLKGLGHPVTFYIYPGTGHWFFEPDRTDAYDETAATLAWERTLKFLKHSFPSL